MGIGCIVGQMLGTVLQDKFPQVQRYSAQWANGLLPAGHANTPIIAQYSDAMFPTFAVKVVGGVIAVNVPKVSPVFTETPWFPSGGELYRAVALEYCTRI